MPHWTYYLRGAGGEELAQYSGVKSLDGSAVALYLEQFSVAGEFIVAPDGEKWYFTYDHQGNVRCKYKKDEAQFFDYTPFGAEINSNYNDPNGWIASERDFESRYMNLQARLYDPVIGRFLAVDPLAEIQIGITPYHYCGNDPVNYSDPSGLYAGEYSSRGNSGGYSGIIDLGIATKSNNLDMEIPAFWDWHLLANIGVDGNSIYSDYSYKTIGGMVLDDGFSTAYRYSISSGLSGIVTNWSSLTKNQKEYLTTQYCYSGIQVLNYLKYISPL